jgi:hypothetical protein
MSDLHKPTRDTIDAMAFRIEAAHMLLDIAFWAIVDSTPHETSENVTFYDIIPMCTDTELRNTYDKAWEELMSLRTDAVKRGLALFGPSISLLHWR